MTTFRKATTFRDAIDWTSEKLGNRLESELLLAHLLGRNRAWLYAHGSETCPPEIESRFRELVGRREGGEPIAYIIGHREFYGREFQVNGDVLIPRPETELLVEQALSLDLPDQASVLDIGTGSGCIAITLGMERPTWKITAVDISAAALAVAETNRNRLGADAVRLLQGNLFDTVDGQHFDLVVSNPPYVAENDRHLEQGDLRFEPNVALSAGPDGLNLIRDIVSQAPRHLHSDGWLMLEHGHDQAVAVRDTLTRADFDQVQSKPDLAGIERISFGRSC